VDVLQVLENQVQLVQQDILQVEAEVDLEVLLKQEVLVVVVMVIVVVVQMDQLIWVEALEVVVEVLVLLEDLV
tara:strand:+ start:346 stop:564 length:219 start_codon:yes stop_codon:yes gene_type:complete